MGEQQVAVIDPGPDVDDHIRALSLALQPAHDVRIILTHRHSDHAGGAPRLAATLGVSIYAPSGYTLPDESHSGELDDESGRPEVVLLSDGDAIPTDAGELLALATPGHSRDHLSFHWPEERAVFVGDVLLGKGETTWVGEYLGCVGDYLDSLDRLQDLEPRVLYPSHGRPIADPAAAIERFRAHRLGRLQEVRDLQERHPDAGPDELARRIYGGEIPEKLVKAARSSVEAALYHFEEQGENG